MAQKPWRLYEKVPELERSLNIAIGKCFKSGTISYRRRGFSEIVPKEHKAHMYIGCVALF